MTLLLLPLVLLSCGPEDYRSWKGYIAAVENAFEQTQSCGELLEIPAAMLDGSAYFAEPVWVGAQSSESRANFSYDGTWQYLEGKVQDAFYEQAGGNCYEDFRESLPPDLTEVAWFWVGDHGPTFPRLISDGSEGGSSMTTWYGIASHGLEFLGSNAAAASHADFTFAWACIESIVGPPGIATGPADWQGIVFVHAEEWVLPDGSRVKGGKKLKSKYGGGRLPLDVALDLSVVDCVISEDAGKDRDPSYCYNWSGDCDGIDNDLDGQVDEGEGVDADGNGVADCMDDWDGDGIVNHEDPDIVECCCDEY